MNEFVIGTLQICGAMVIFSILCVFLGVCCVAVLVALGLIKDWFNRYKITRKNEKDEYAKNVHMCAIEMKKLYKFSKSKKSYNEWLAEMAEKAREDWQKQRGAAK